MKEGKCDQYVDRPAARPRREADADAKPLAKTIRINRIFTKSEHLGATNNSKKRKIQQARSVFQVQAINVVPGPIVGFSEQDAEGVDFPSDDALVISVQLAHAIINKIMEDNNNSVNILQLPVIQKMGLESTIKHKAKVLTGFNELTSIVIGTITFDVTSPPIVTSQTFMIVSDPSPQNGILGRPWLVKIKAVTSIEY